MHQPDLRPPLGSRSGGGQYSGFPQVPAYGNVAAPQGYPGASQPGFMFSGSQPLFGTNMQQQAVPPLQPYIHAYDVFQREVQLVSTRDFQHLKEWIGKFLQRRQHQTHCQITLYLLRTLTWTVGGFGPQWTLSGKTSTLCVYFIIFSSSELIIMDQVLEVTIPRIQAVLHKLIAGHDHVKVEMAIKNVVSVCSWKTSSWSFPFCQQMCTWSFKCSA